MPANKDDPIDAAYTNFLNLLSQLKVDAQTIITEQDTRLKIIDPVFISVLQWSQASIFTEEYTGTGFVDYKLTINGLGKVIVEAKKDSIPFGLEHRSAGKAYKLNGAALSQTPQPRGGIMQAMAYCGSKNTELACVTNGNEWIIFRGSRLGDGKDTLDGMAYIFPTLDSIAENFKLFFDLLARSAVDKLTYRSYFQEAEGQPIRIKAFCKTLHSVNGYRLIDRSSLSIDIDRVMAAFFRRLSGDDEEEMLAECFVVTKESQIADERLGRITDDLVASVKSLETEEAKALTEVIERVRDTQRNEFVLLIGTKGAGKSTFTDRFFRFVLDDDIRKNCLIVRLNVGNSSGDPRTVVSWLDEHLLKLLESSLFGEFGATYDELQGMFFDEYKRWVRGPYSYLYNNNREAFKEKFGEYMETWRNTKQNEYIKLILRRTVSGRRKVPCIVFDNTDHFTIEFQEIVYQYARSIYESEMCLILIPITDKTSWQLSRQGVLQSFESEAFFLPTPSPKHILEKRINFIEKKIDNERQQKGTGYFLKKGIKLSLDNIQAFVSCLQHLFLQTGMVAKWIGNLANNDIRRCLALTRNLMSSPYLNIDDLVRSYISKSNLLIPEDSIKKSIILMGYNIYPSGQNEFLQNIFSLNTEVETTPLLSLRLLRLLRDAKHHDAGSLEDFVTIEQVLDYMQGIGIDRRATLLSLGGLLKTGLCFSYDPTITEIANVKKIQLSPSGMQHMHWGSWDDIYISEMIKVTPIVNEEIHTKLGLYRGTDLISVSMRMYYFLKYIIEEDRAYIINTDHPAYQGQNKLIGSIWKKRLQVMERLQGLDISV